MKIVIGNEDEWFTLSELDKMPLINCRERYIQYRHRFSAEDIENLIGTNKYNSKFLKGEFVFNVTKKHLLLITGDRGPANKTERLMYQS